MTWNNLYILPILALIACKLLPVLPDKRRSRRLRNKRRKTRSYSTLFSRWLVFSLLASTVLTLLYPYKEYPAIVQGLVITAMFMIPVMLFIAISHLIYSTFYKLRESEDENFASHGQLPANHPDASLHGAASNTALNTGLSRSQIAELAEIGSGRSITRDEHLLLPNALHGNTGRYSDSASADLYAEGEFNNNQNILNHDIDMMNSNDTAAHDAIMREQLERVSKNIGTYDLGTEQSPPKRTYSEHAEIFDANEQQPEDTDSTGYTDIFDSVDHKLPQKSEKALVLKRKFIALQEDKKNLQRLVLAQQAAFDSERLAHERSRTMAKEAIKIMRDARESQRIAVKVARLERSKRKSIEMEYVKVNKALVNALSTIQSGENAKHGNRGSLASSRNSGN